uniref:NADH-ubiquinone oxidoreductase chain 2 n=1 Tax=Hyphessobrycon herbertaxelrodi TaxID=681895 RepID=A0A7H1KFH6_9TELE|nr:NADH dehydrogenase subunit 2 [Hyphessobrycon herbertaxelrodi]QNT25985.1 NADH dehydrogenase subunit 2 [Hyphessobrycon herbertaxelrodi]QOW38132.1 NADH dehydrogenase subunit 2 [Hyphessobrycon herbertaxelrodi]
MAAMTYYLFFYTLGLGTLLTFISSHWLIAWAGLEINMFAIVPLMAKTHHPRASEAATKYFITQAFASAILLLGTIFNGSTWNTWDISQIETPGSIVLITLALSIKLGMVPLHFWLPEVMQGIDLTTGLILATWQKLAPFALLLQITHNTYPLLLIIFGLTSAWAASWAGLNQTQLRKILAYSSIAHLGWMLVIIQCAPEVAIFALGIYILMTTAAFLTLKETSATNMSKFTLAWSKTPVMMILMSLILLSLVGLPPLMGFSLKLVILEEMSKQDMHGPATMLAMSSLISLYFYMRLCYFTIISLFPGTTMSKTSWRRKKKRDKITLATVATAAVILLPLGPFIAVLVYFFI